MYSRDQDESSDLEDPWDNVDAAFRGLARPHTISGEVSGRITSESGSAEEPEEEAEEEEGDTCSSEEMELESKPPPPVPYDDAETLTRQQQLEHRHRLLEERRDAFSAQLQKARQQHRRLNIKRLKDREEANREMARLLLEAHHAMPQKRQLALEELRRALSNQQTHFDVPEEVDRAAQEQTRQLSIETLAALTAHLNHRRLSLLAMQADVWTLQTPEHVVMVAEPRQAPKEGENAYLFYIMVARDALKL